jgi:hypothetical protein
MTAHLAHSLAKVARGHNRPTAKMTTLPPVVQTTAWEKSLHLISQTSYSNVLESPEIDDYLRCTSGG